MIHEAYMPVYRCQDFYCGRAGECTGFTRGSTRGPRGPKNVNQVKSNVKEKDLEFDPSLTPDVSIGRWFFFNSITKKGYKTMVEFMLNLMLKDGIQESVAHNAAFQAGFVAVKAPFAVVETAASIVPGLGSFVGAGTSWTTCYCSLMTMLSANIEIAKSSILVIQEMANEKMK